MVSHVIIGPGGLVGQNLGKILTEKKHSWKGLSRSPPKQQDVPWEKMDLTDFAEVREKMSLLKPQVVYHCANLAGGVNYCEANPLKARQFHLEATQNLGLCCLKLGAHLVYLSTDYVFPGGEAPKEETDDPWPLNVYGRLKWESEKWIQENLLSYTIIRTTNIYGLDRETTTPNYFMQIFRSLEKGGEWKAPGFLWGTPTYAEDLALAMEFLGTKRENGLFHAVGPEFLTRLAWSEQVARFFGFDPGKIREAEAPPPGTVEAVQRPHKIRLSSKKLQEIYRGEFKNVEQGLVAIKKEMEMEMERGRKS